MANSYGQETDTERHERSLKAADELAEKAKLISLERGWSYQRSANYVRAHDSRLAELEKHGYLSQEPSRNYTYSSLEAGEKISDLAKKLQREKKISYQAAVDEILSDPRHREVAICYSQAD
jgi:hypothetical protein